MSDLSEQHISQTVLHFLVVKQLYVGEGREKLGKSSEHLSICEVHASWM